MRMAIRPSDVPARIASGRISAGSTFRSMSLLLCRAECDAFRHTSFSARPRLTA